MSAQPARTAREPDPPSLFCPRCDQVLRYRESVYGGVKPPERWDYFDCASCGKFVYRDRTRKLRRV